MTPLQSAQIIDGTTGLWGTKTMSRSTLSWETVKSGRGLLPPSRLQCNGDLGQDADVQWTVLPGLFPGDNFSSKSPVSWRQNLVPGKSRIAVSLAARRCFWPSAGYKFSPADCGSRSDFSGWLQGPVLMFKSFQEAYQFSLLTAWDCLPFLWPVLFGLFLNSHPNGLFSFQNTVFAPGLSSWVLYHLPSLSADDPCLGFSLCVACHLGR